MDGKLKILMQKIESKGIELEALYKKSENFNISFNYNYTDTHDGADCDDPNVGSTSCIDQSMVRVPRHSSNINFSIETKNNLENFIYLKYNGEVEITEMQQ